MAGFIHLLKSLFIPLFVAALIYILGAYLLLPFIRRHRNSYLPLSLSTTTTPTSSSSIFSRSRITASLLNLFIPSRDNFTDDELFDDEEGEGMVGFDPIDERRREALEQRRSLMEGERRLSRVLEEGFRDESDDEEGEGEQGDERRRSLSRERGGMYY